MTASPGPPRCLTAVTCAILAGALSGCHHTIVGNGDEQTEPREADLFDAVSGAGSVDVTVEVGVDEAVWVTCDSNLLEYIETYTQGDTLFVEVRRRVNISPHATCVVQVSADDLREIETSGSGDIDTWGPAPDLASVESSGSGDIHAEDLESAELRVHTSGSGDVDLQGTVADVEIASSGSGDLNTRELQAETAGVDTSGSGDVEVHASDSIDIDLSGSGDVDVWGTPVDRSEDVSGSGDVHYH